MRDAVTFGVLELTLRQGSYAWRFVPESRGIFSDAGSDSCTGPTIDNDPPATPSAPSATSVASDHVGLSWPATTDNDGVAGYRVLRDGVEIGTTATSAVATSFTDTTTQPGQTYQYQLIAQDAVGNLSQSSSVTTVTTPTP